MVKNTGIIRKIDDLGRICIPMELRRLLSFNFNKVTINLDDDNISIIVAKDSETKNGIIRPVDQCGRLSVPAEIKKRLSMENGDYVSFFIDLDNQQMILRKYLHKCIFCGNNSYKDLEKYKNIPICKNCIDNIKKNF